MLTSDDLSGRFTIVPLATAKGRVQQRLRSAPDDAGIIDILDRVLDKGIVMDPSTRLLLAAMDLRLPGTRILVAPERRRRPFVIPQPSRHF